MNLTDARRRIVVGSSLVAALLATGYAISEHHNSVAQSERLAEAQYASASVSQDEARDANETYNEEVLPRVRQAARDFIQETKPGAKAEGVFTLALRGDSLYIAGVDVTDGGQHRTIDLLVRLYVKKSGGQYWRAESLGPDRAAALMDKVSAPPDTTTED